MLRVILYTQSRTKPNFPEANTYTHTHAHTRHPNPNVMAGDGRNEMTWNSWFAADILLLLLTEILRRIIWLLLLLSYLLVTAVTTAADCFSRVAYKAPGPRRIIYTAHMHTHFSAVHIGTYITSVYYALVISLLPTSRLLHSTRLDAVRQKIKTNKIIYTQEQKKKYVRPPPAENRFENRAVPTCPTSRSCARAGIYGAI